jgi:hypothetical protein
MAVVKGVKEKVHLPLYDSVSVKGGRRLGEILTSNVLRFFLDVNGKTKLQTNMQAAALLPHWNTFEARALRVVISDLPPQFTDTPTANIEFDLTNAATPPKGTVTFSVRNLVDLRRRIEGPQGSAITFTNLVQPADFDLKLNVTGRASSTTPPDQLESGETFIIDRAVLREVERRLIQAGGTVPTNEQVFPNDGFGTLIGKFIYNTVTTFFVGEKIMIQVPTWFFPAGAGPYSEDGRVTTHGYPNPQATFRFAEPVTIDTQQNFRVEIEVPESDVLADLQRLYGPLFIWVVLDGYMTRDVQ